MHRDFKIGLIVGLVLLIVAMIWIAGHESLSTHARLAREQSISYPPADTQKPVVPAAPIEEQPIAVAPPVEEPLPIESDTKIATEPIFSRPVDIPPEPEPQVQPEPKEEPLYHVVAEGQSLSTIAKIHYGSSAQWKRILDANPTVVRDAHKLRPGMRLLIPPAEK
jgi:nucleoid-associated protein YgaU